MARPLLPALTLLFALPAGVLLWQGAELSRLFSSVAVAAPADLLDGCGDVPEAVALAEELRDRALRIERYMASLDGKKDEIAAAEASLREHLGDLRAQRDRAIADQNGATQAVRTDIDRLIALYDQMKPAEAAAILTNLPADFAAEILMRVQPEAGARIIAAVDPRQAALLTAQMGARSVRTP